MFEKIRTFICCTVLLSHIGFAASSCPLVCPDGWKTIFGVGNNHCYLFPPVPIPTGSFDYLQNYCQSKQPTSYILCVNTFQEYSAGGLSVVSYLFPYGTGTFYVYIGAYYQNGQFHWLDGTPWGYNAIAPKIPLVYDPPPPQDGDCVYIDPRSKAANWYYRPCTDNLGATVCEMDPIPDCNATPGTTTTIGPYVPPDCNTAKYTDFARQLDNGFLGIGPLRTLTGYTTESCAVACTYYSGCLSFDISVTGDCRLLGKSNLAQCGRTFQIDDDYTHYDMVFIQ